MVKKNAQSAAPEGGVFVRKMEKRILYLIVILGLALFGLLELPNLFRAGLTFYAFDVGQGDAALFRFPDGATMLVDAGPRKSAKDLVGKLRRLGVKRIDILVATHPHEDHIGGMVEVIRSFPVGKIWDSGYNHGSSVQRAMLDIIKEKGIRFGRPKAGFRELAGDVAIDILAPAEPIAGTTSDANNNGIVMQVSYGRMSFLMMGDIEERGRSAIEAFPRSVVLKVSHHGSHNGTDRRLLNEARPSIAVLSYGEGNSYGHPHKSVMHLLREAQVETYATVNGDIEIWTDGETYSLEQGE